MKLCVHTLANIDFVPAFATWSVELWHASIAICAFCIVSTVLTNTATGIISMHINWFSLLVYFFIVDAFVTVVETIASCNTKRLIKWWTQNGAVFITFTFEWVRFFSQSPRFLFEARTTTIALWSTCIVSAQTDQDGGVCWISIVAWICMAVTHTTPSNTNIFNWIEVSSCYSWILFCDRHQVSQEIFGS